jgi:hypothetical protein
MEGRRWARQLFDLGGERHSLVHVFDAFDPKEEYGVVSPFISVSRERVIQNFRNFNDNISSTQFHEGLSQHTLKDFSSQYKDTTLVVLRIDGNNYDFYQNTLYYLCRKFLLVDSSSFMMFALIRSPCKHGKI